MLEKNIIVNEADYMKKIFLITLILFGCTLEVNATTSEMEFYSKIEAEQNGGVKLHNANFDAKKYQKVLTEKTDAGKTVRYFDYNSNLVKRETYNKDGHLRSVSDMYYDAPDSDKVIKSAKVQSSGEIRYYNRKGREITSQEFDKILQ